MRKKRKKQEEEVGDDLSVCVLKFLPEDSTLPSSEDISRFVKKWRYKFFKLPRDLTLVT